MIWIRHSLLRYEKYHWQVGNKITKIKNILLAVTIIFSLNVCLYAQKQMNFNHIGLYTMHHTIIRIHSENEEIYHIADVVHSEIISFEHPEWIYNSDTDCKEGIETRKKILEQLSNFGSLFFAYHLPWLGLGYVKSTADGYKWVQKQIVML